MNQHVICIATFHAKSGQEQALKQALMTLVPQTRKESGCLSYELCQKQDDARTLTMLEKYQDRAAYDFHGKQAYLAHLVEQLPALTDNFSIDVYQPA
jgi:quinol monooxygenase YgiN